MAEAGLGDDLLLANEVADASRLGVLARTGARVTVAVDSDATVDAAARAGVREVLVDVNVGLPRCGCRPEDAGRLADRARAASLTVRGVMGYEGHIVGLEDRAKRVEMIEVSMAQLVRAHDAVGGDLISAGGTGTYDLNTWATEIQAGSYALMDTAYAKLGLPFVHALSVVSTVISVSKGWAVADCGLKSLGMDHGNPSIKGAEVWYCSDEHVVFAPQEPVGSAIACACCRRTSIRRSRITNTCTWLLVTTSWSAGTSICAGGEPRRRLRARGPGGPARLPLRAGGVPRQPARPGRSSPRGG